MLGGFSASHSINGSSEPFCIKRKGVFLFLFFSLKRELTGVLLYIRCSPSTESHALKQRAVHCLSMKIDLNIYPKWKNAGLKNKFLLTFQTPISSIRSPTWPEKNPFKPRKFFLRHINFSICFVKQPFFALFLQKKEEKTLCLRALSSSLVQR